MHALHRAGFRTPSGEYNRARCRLLASDLMGGVRAVAVDLVMADHSFVPFWESGSNTHPAGPGPLL